MEKVEYYSQYGKNRPTDTKEAFRKPSLTEPDNAMSIPDIIARFTRGQGMPVPQHPWQSGSAPEDGEFETPQDGSLEDVLELEKPEDAAPAGSASEDPSSAHTPAPAGA